MKIKKSEGMQGVHGPNFACSLPSSIDKGRGSQDMISSWIKGAEEVRISSILYSLSQKLLWALTMEFLSPQQHRLNFSLPDMPKNVIALFPKGETQTLVQSLYASVLSDFGHTTRFQPCLTEILMFHECRSRDWRPRRENSCKVCPHSARLQKNLCVQLQADLTPNHDSVPEQNSIGNRFQSTVLIKKWSQSSSLASEFLSNWFRKKE